MVKKNTRVWRVIIPLCILIFSCTYVPQILEVSIDNIPIDLDQTDGSQKIDFDTLHRKVQDLVRSFYPDGEYKYLNIQGTCPDLIELRGEIRFTYQVVKLVLIDYDRVGYIDVNVMTNNLPVVIKYLRGQDETFNRNGYNYPTVDVRPIATDGQLRNITSLVCSYQNNAGSRCVESVWISQKPDYWRATCLTQRSGTGLILRIDTPGNHIIASEEYQTSR